MATLLYCHMKSPFHCTFNAARTNVTVNSAVRHCLDCLGETTASNRCTIPLSVGQCRTTRYGYAVSAEVQHDQHYMPMQAVSQGLSCAKLYSHHTVIVARQAEGLSPHSIGLACLLLSNPRACCLLHFDKAWSNTGLLTKAACWCNAHVSAMFSL